MQEYREFGLILPEFFREFQEVQEEVHQIDSSFWLMNHRFVPSSRATRAAVVTRTLAAIASMVPGQNDEAQKQLASFAPFYSSFEQNQICFDSTDPCRLY